MSIKDDRAGWRKSPYSNGGEACVEVKVWRKSPYSTNGGDCVEVGVGQADETAAASAANADTLYVMRDSKDPDGPRLHFAPAEWDAFTYEVKDGTFDDI